MLAIALLVLLPILAKLPQLTGVLSSDPRIQYAHLTEGPDRNLLGGRATVDPNVAYTSHALGSRAARDLWSGTIPWWNHDEGIGQPLVGEMQSAALFPPTWLMLLPNGQLLEHVAFQILAGLFTFALLRRLSLSVLAAGMGGVAYAFNPVYAWFANATINPVLFLPLFLLGIELVADPDRRQRLAGGVLVAASVAGSLYAGFPEVAYIDGLLALGWAAVTAMRAPRGDRIWSVARIAFWGSAGLLTAAPLLCAFLAFLPFGELGGHQNDAFGANVVNPVHLSALVIPYIFGGIESRDEASAFWITVGGYTGLVLPTLAILGALSRRLGARRPLLVAWTGFALLASYGFPPAQAAKNLIPGMGLVGFQRYCTASWFLSLTILAAAGADELGRQGIARRLALSGLAMLGFTAITALVAVAAGARLFAGNVALLSTLVLAGVLGAGVLVRLAPRPEVARRLCVAAACLELVALFVIPTFSHRLHGRVQDAGVTFLKTRIGMDRFATTGPITPNYGSYYGLAQANYNDLPALKGWAQRVHARLDAGADEIAFDGEYRRPDAKVSGLDQVSRNRRAFGDAGVRYIVTFPRQSIPGARMVFADRVMRIFDLGPPRPYVQAPACSIGIATKDDVTATCNRPSTLYRLEGWMPGWTATIGSARRPVAPWDGIFQQVALPRGTSRVRFAYAPPYLTAAVALAAAGVLLIVAGAAYTLRGPARRGLARPR